MPRVAAGVLAFALLSRAGMAAKRFEELDAWKLAHELKKQVYALLNGSKATSDRKFCDQLIASAASAPANLAEGFGYYRHPEFAKHTRIAKASLMETKNHLGDGVDRDFWSAQHVDPLLHLSDRAIGACVRLVAYLETSDAPGTRKADHSKTRSTFPIGEQRSHVGSEDLAPDITAPGTTAPGTTAPGTTAPGTTAPGTTAPGTTAPGTTAPGTTAPGTIAPDTSTKH